MAGRRGQGLFLALHGVSVGHVGERLLEHLCIIYSTATSDHVVGGTGESHLV